MERNLPPVTMGSPEFVTMELGPFRVSEARFPPSLVLAPHVHERPIVAVIIEGSWEQRFTHTSHECVPSTVLIEPAEERHANHFQKVGARVLVVEPDPALADLFGPCGELLDSTACFRNQAVTAVATRVVREMKCDDAASTIAVEGLVLELLAVATRAHSRDTVVKRGPPWARQARELIHDRFNKSIRITDIAAAVEVHPIHLARVFREHFGESVCEYQRRLRLEWAADRLANSDEPLAKVATRAGFSDQSHLTRVFKSYSGLTPAEYRRATL